MAAMLKVVAVALQETRREVAHAPGKTQKEHSTYRFSRCAPGRA